MGKEKMLDMRNLDIGFTLKIRSVHRLKQLLAINGQIGYGVNCVLGFEIDIDFLVFYQCEDVTYAPLVAPKHF